VSDDVAELYDYDVVRHFDEATMLVSEVERTTLVLGGSQAVEVLNPESLGAVTLRRRRGGGGIVLLNAGDIWIDWWIPHTDPRWRDDVHASSIQVGRWWAKVLGGYDVDDVAVHEGKLEGELAYRTVCFAGRGPGEVFVKGRKLVGVTQWRVRQGVFVSTVLHARPSGDVLSYLAVVPEGLAKALDHEVLDGLRLPNPERLVDDLVRASGPWRRVPTPLL
jgi:lipoate-protein ligase A